jgi:hypothetical protein
VSLTNERDDQNRCENCFLHGRPQSNTHARFSYKNKCGSPLQRDRTFLGKSRDGKQSCRTRKRLSEGMTIDRVTCWLGSWQLWSVTAHV